VNHHGSGCLLVMDYVASLILIISNWSARVKRDLWAFDASFHLASRLCIVTTVSADFSGV
jgi:hypothetical protein